MSWKLKVISPVHIGSGQKVGSLGFLFDGASNGEEARAYYVLPETLFRALAEAFGNLSDLLDRFTETMLKAASGKGRGISWVVEQIADAPASAALERLRELSAYQIQYVSDAQDAKEIALHIKQEPDLVYVPGSSIKGAIRTAILYAYFREHPEQLEEVVISALKSFKQAHDGWYRQVLPESPGDPVRRGGRKKKKKRKDKTPRQELRKAFDQAFGPLREHSVETVLHGYPKSELCEKDEPPEECRRRPNFSIMRHILVPDTKSIPAERCLCIAEVKLVGASRRIRFFQETILPGTQFEWRGVQLEARKDYMTGSSNRLQKDGEQRTPGWDVLCEKIGYTEYQQEFASQQDTLLKHIRAFSAAIIEAEREYWTQRANGDSGRERELATNILASLDDLAEKNRQSAPLLRIGANEGFLSTTICLLLRGDPGGVYSGVLLPLMRPKKANRDLFPQTRRVVRLPGESANAGHLAGWVQIVPDNA